MRNKSALHAAVDAVEHRPKPDIVDNWSFSAGDSGLNVTVSRRWGGWNWYEAALDDMRAVFGLCRVRRGYVWPQSKKHKPLAQDVPPSEWEQ